MQKYVFIKSPMKAAQLLNAGFSYLQAPYNSHSGAYIFEHTEALMIFLLQNFDAADDYMVKDGALLTF